MTAYGAKLTVSHEPSSVRRARHAVAAGLDEAGLASIAYDDTLLVLSELVSNAVRHAIPLPSGYLQVSWHLEPELVHLEVTDGGSATRPGPSVAAITALGGRGLEIVRIVSRDWGVTEGAGSVTVWADVPTDQRLR